MAENGGSGLGLGAGLAMTGAGLLTMASTLVPKAAVGNVMGASGFTDGALLVAGGGLALGGMFLASMSGRG